jgi:hypothetical protein
VNGYEEINEAVPYYYSNNDNVRHIFKTAFKLHYEALPVFHCVSGKS